MTSRDEPTEAKRISDVIIDLLLVTFGLCWGINITKTIVTSKDWLCFRMGKEELV